MDSASVAALEEMHAASSKAVQVVADAVVAEREQLKRCMRVIDEREAAVAERESAVAEREAAIAARLASIEQRERELEDSCAPQTSHKILPTAATEEPSVAAAPCPSASPPCRPVEAAKTKTGGLASLFAGRLPASPARAAQSFPGTTPLPLSVTELVLQSPSTSATPTNPGGKSPSAEPTSPRTGSTNCNPQISPSSQQHPPPISPRVSTTGASKLKQIFEKGVTPSRQRGLAPTSRCRAAAKVSTEPTPSLSRASEKVMTAASAATALTVAAAPEAEAPRARGVKGPPSPALDTSSAGTATSLKEMFEKKSASAQKNQRLARAPRRTWVEGAVPVAGATNDGRSPGPSRASGAKTRRGSEPLRQYEDELSFTGAADGQAV